MSKHLAGCDCSDCDPGGRGIIAALESRIDDLEERLTQLEAEHEAEQTLRRERAERA